MQETFDVRLNDFIFGGDMIGRLPDGRAVFVPFGLPGELVRVHLVEEKANFTRAVIDKILEPSPVRIAARCKHFGTCGGCNYQHLSYADQLAAKKAIVKDQLKRLGGLPDFPVADVVPSPDPWNYRNTVQFNVSQEGTLGYQKANSNEFVAVRECHLPSPAINDLWPQIELEAETGVDRVILREGIEQDLILGLVSKTDLAPDFSVDFPISAVYISPNGTTPLSGDESVLMQVNGRDFRVSIESFFQVNPAQAGAMVEHVLKLAGNLKGKTVIDAYCGVGLFSAFLAPKAARLIGIELSESSCDDYAVNLDEFSNVELYLDAVENVLPSLDLKPDLVVIDPPRAGLESRVITALAEMSPAQIIYVSCDPATLARDLKRLLLKGYTLESVTPFDQFPQTYHIECIANLSRSENTTF
ncbi:MAG: class I SAM-dependent RNA methyltransferase [Anaerolineaceae bacterium]|nr:class I SAM-dependent RNA methyltransferase [Anaerolineaceae bacterium]